MNITPQERPLVDCHFWCLFPSPACPLCRALQHYTMEAPKPKPTEPDTMAETRASHPDDEQPEKPALSPESEESSAAEDSSTVLTGAPFVLLVFSLVLSSWLVALNGTVIGTVRSPSPLPWRPVSTYQR